jgi:hypothetical protein
MAFNPQQIAPIDLNPSLAVGVNLPFKGLLFLIQITKLKMLLKII